MHEIHVTKLSEDQTGAVFKVELADFNYRVTIDNDYFQKLTGGQADHQTLIRRSFEFLLEKEPPSAILSEFNLSIIGEYFDDYESVIKQRI